MEMQSLEFSQRVFDLDLVQYVLIMIPFLLHVGTVMYILYYYMLKICDLFFDFDFTGIMVKRLYESQKRL